MATVNKDFRVKHGLVVEGATGTIDGSDIITEDIITGGTQTNITVTYDAEEKVLNFEANAAVTEEDIQDAVGNAISAGAELSSGGSIVYDDEEDAIYITVEDQVGSLTTDDIEQGSTNLYYTDDLVKDVLTGATKENISISVDEEGVLTIAAENGVDDSTTDDLDEGETNLYYTDTRVYTKAKTALVEGTGISLTADDEEETITIDVDTDEIASKSYVDSVAQGLKIRGNVEAATTEDLDAVYDNGTDGVDATLNLGPLATLNIDGWTQWEELDGILVKDQDNALENGRYFVFQVGDAETDWILKRCIYCDETEEIPGSYVFVQHGTTYEATGWVATVANLGTFEVGTDDINWVQFSGAGTFTAGNGLELDGTEFSIDTEVTVDIDSEQTLTNKTIDGEDNTLTNIANESLVNDSITVNGVEGALGETITLTTDDIDEAEESPTNLYFTDQRAIDALEAVVPDFQAVEINTVAKQVAATVILSTAEVTDVVYSFLHEDYRAAKFLVKLKAGSHTEIVEVLLTLDSTNNIAMTEYAIVGTNGNLGTISAVVGGTGNDEVRLTVNPVNASTQVDVYGTLLK